jgi:protein-disulfide isomerase
MSKQHEGMSRRELRRENRRRADQRRRLFWIGLVTVVAVIVAFLLILPSIRPIGAIATAVPLERPQVQANTTGDPNAPIKIEEFSDFQCPFCKRFYDETEALLVENYVATGKVYFVYRSAGNWVSDNINRVAGTNNSESADSAQAAYCAGDQDKFWEMHDMLFANQTRENGGDFTARRLVAFAETLSLDLDEFRSCFNGGEYSDEVDQDLEDAAAAGIQGTPHFVLTYTLDGQVVTFPIGGAQPYSVFQQELDRILAEMGLE